MSPRRWAGAFAPFEFLLHDDSAHVTASFGNLISTMRLRKIICLADYRCRLILDRLPFEGPVADDPGGPPRPNLRPEHGGMFE